MSTNLCINSFSCLSLIDLDQGKVVGVKADKNSLIGEWFIRQSISAL